MDVSIIIVNYNTKELTRNCLKSVFEQTKSISFEVIISDNSSKDGSIEMIKSEGIDKTHIFCYQNNETGQSFWRDFGFEKREDVFVYSYNNNK